MQPLTEQQTQRVWSRVMSAQTTPTAAMENPAPAAQAQSETLTPEKLLSLTAEADAALFRFGIGRVEEFPRFSDELDRAEKGASLS